MSKFLDLFKKSQTENRADGEVTIDSGLLSALLGNEAITKDKALQIPTVCSAIEKLAETVAKLPLKLYKNSNGKVEEVADDRRTFLFNVDTGDTLSTVDFWKAIIEDYFLDKGAYAYINKEKGKVKSIHYVDASRISIQTNQNPIFKDFDMYIDGEKYHQFDFIKILRKTKNGATSKPICEESSRILAVAYNSIIFEDNLVKKGGNKRGFLTAKTRVSNPEQLRTDFARLYQPDNDSIVILNDGMEFKESSATSVEMQLNENKVTNGQEIFKLFGFPASILTGNASQADKDLFTECVIGLLNSIEASLDKDLLLEKEKGLFYFAFDTKELTRGNMKERFEAYGIGIDKHFLQTDEIRKFEDMDPIGFNFVKLGLGDVLYNPETKEVFIPNTNSSSKLDDLKGGDKE